MPWDEFDKALSGRWHAIVMILLTGGSACGKSSYAESLCGRMGKPCYYLATMRPYGDGSAQRIERHRNARKDKGFITIERYTDLDSLTLPERGTLLLECICNLTANEMFDDKGKMIDPYDAVIAGVNALRAQCDNLILVTNDVGSEYRAYDDGTEAYIAAIGRINATLAAMSDVVYELVCGIPMLIKGASRGTNSAETAKETSSVEASSTVGAV